MPLDSKSEFTVITARDPRAKAFIQEIAPAIDSLTRTRKVKLELKNPARVFPGEFVRVSIPQADRNALLLPATALVERGQLEIIFTVENHRARMLLVKTAKRSSDTVEILSGLEPGVPVVIEKADQLKDGQPIKVNE